jgi:hypothetical protein
MYLARKGRRVGRARVERFVLRSPHPNGRVAAAFMPKGGIVPPPVQVRTSFRRRPGAHGDRTQADGALGRLPPSGLGQFRSREPRPVSGADRCAA